jgi:hypothetical protein
MGGRRAARARSLLLETDSSGPSSEASTDISLGELETIAVVELELEQETRLFF